jgi:hypothetical protein
LTLLGEASNSSDCGAALGGEDHTALASLEAEPQKRGEVVRARGEKIKFLKTVFYLLREKGKGGDVSLGFEMWRERRVTRLALALDME